MRDAPDREVGGLRGWGTRYGFAVLVTALAALMRWALDPLLHDTSQYLLFYFSVMVAALVAGTGPGVLAILLGAVAGVGYFVFVGHLGPSWADDISRMVLFVLFGAVATALARRLHEARDRAARTAEALRRTSEQVRLQAAALEAAPNAISLSKTDPQGTIVWVNPAFTRLTGYSAEEAIGRTHHILSSGVQDEAFYRTLWETIKQGKVWRGELVNRRKDGTLYHEEMGVTPLRDEQGRITHYVAVKQDITARREAEAALRESEHKYRVVAEHTYDWEFWLGPDGRFLYCSPSCQRVTGYEAAAFLADPALLGRIVHPEDRATYEAHQGGGQACATEEAQFRIVHRDGSTRWIEHLCHPLHDEAGRLLGVRGSNRDITARREVEAALRESEHFYRQTLESIPGMVFTTRPDGYCDYQSQQWVQFTGVPMSEHLGDGWNKLLHPDDRPRAYAAWRDAVEGRAAYDLEYRVRRHDGEYRWFKVRGQPIRDAEGRIVRWFGVCLDIEDLKRTEEALAGAKRSAERAKADAEEASRAKDHFLAVLSHELRNPLTPVLPALGALDLLVPAEGREYLEMARRNVELEARLIDDLLDVTRIARGKIELERQVVELCTVVHRAAEVCRPDIEARRVHFEIRIDNQPHPVDVDAARLQQVFWNLIKNAIKFTAHGGCVGVRCWREDGRAFVEVSDSGVGIEAEALSRIFNAFEQEARSTTRQFGGLGLGLAISKALVEMHGGRIRARSDGKDKGAVFTVELPLAIGSPAEKGPAQAPSAAGTASATERKLRILLVEDHGDTARIMKRLLSAEGHEVQHAGDVATALELAGREPFDVVLSDLGLPDGSGLDLMRHLRGGGSRVPGIALSGYGMAADVQASREAGFAEHLVKPLNFQSLRAALGRVVEAPPSA